MADKIISELRELLRDKISPNLNSHQKEARFLTHLLPCYSQATLCGGSVELSPQAEEEKGREELMSGPRHTLGQSPSHKGTPQSWLTKHSQDTCPQLPST